MGRAPSDSYPSDPGGPSSRCPACGSDLDGRATPPNSVVLCAHCGTPLYWDVTFSVLTAEQLEALPEADRQRLCTLLSTWWAALGATPPS